MSIFEYFSEFYKLTFELHKHKYLNFMIKHTFKSVSFDKYLILSTKIF